MPYWKATVEKPDAAGGWQLVGVFGTDANPAGTGRYLHGDTALAAAQLLLGHVWPIALDEPGRYERADRQKRDQDAKTGIAGHRITVEGAARKWDIEYGKPAPEPLVVTVAELRLTTVRQMVAESVQASTKAAELAAQAKAARRDAEHAKWRVESAVKEAALAGVDPAELVRAKRRPRQRRTN